MTEDCIVIREARDDDVESIAKFNIEMALETENKKLEETIVDKGVSAVIEDSQKGFYIVAEKKSFRPSIVGQLLVTYEWSDWRNQNIWWIQSVYVQKSFRNQKIFSKLYDHVLETARNEKNICGIRLYVEEHNESAKQVYKTLGMTKTSYEIFEKELG
jgi:ribosomal protein S18 acetylase RimI-like enzyme